MQRRPGRTAILAAIAALAASALAPATRADTITHAGSQLVPDAPWLDHHVASAGRAPDYEPLVTPSELPSGGSPARPSPELTVSVGSVVLGEPLPPSFVGLSIEYRTLHDYAGTDPRAIDPVFIALMRGLDPGQSPVLRIGGNSTDQTWWPVKGITPPAGVTFGLSRRWMRLARGVATALGSRLILGINLAADNPSLAAAEARALLSGVGRSHIADLEVGNEPDAYPVFAWAENQFGRSTFPRRATYTLQDYIGELTHWGRVLPALPLAGPAFARGTWMASLQSIIASEPKLRLVTFHRYPLRGCEHNPQMPDYPSVANLMADSSSSGLAERVAPFVATAHAAGLPFRLDELNSASCEGRFGVSNTFASALWALDTLFDLAQAGVDGVNLHTLPGTAYQPFQTFQNGSTWSASVAPIYYGLLAFARSFPPGARLLALNEPAGPVKVWATQAKDGRLHVVVINKDPSTPYLVRIQIPGPQSALSSETLSAPSLSATSGVTLGGQSFGARTATGVLPPDPHPGSVPSLLGYYTVAVPAASAVLLTR